MFSRRARAPRLRGPAGQYLAFSKVAAGIAGRVSFKVVVTQLAWPLQNESLPGKLTVPPASRLLIYSMLNLESPGQVV